MNNHNLIIITLLLMSGFVLADVEYTQSQQSVVSSDIPPALKTAILKGKLLATSEGIGNDNNRFGYSVSIEGDRALVSSPEASNGGAVHVIEYNGISWVETHLLMPVAMEVNDHFGLSVSLSGNRALVGAISDKGNGMSYVFDFDGSNWNQTQLLTPNDGFIGNDFGYAVKLEGDKVFIGARNDDNNGTNSGAVYAFEFDGVNWNQFQKITPNDGVEGIRFGNSLSISGNQMLIGAPADMVLGATYGSAYIFEFDGVAWSQTQKLVAADGLPSDWFGYAVSLDGNTAVVGAVQNDAVASNAGAAYVFDFNGINWNESQKIVANNTNEEASFGNSISLVGNRVIIGSYKESVTDIYSGSAYVFDFNGVNWVQSQILTNPYIDASGYDQFGFSVSLSGSRVLVSADLDDELGYNSGSASVFEFDGVDWNHQQKLYSIDSLEDDWFGHAVSLFGNRALVGASRASIDWRNSGAAYIFDFNGFEWLQTYKLSAGEGLFGGGFGRSVSLYEDRALIGSFNASGAAYVFDFDGLNWNLTQKLTPINNIDNNAFGVAVSLFESRALIGASYEDGSRGAAYVFDFDDINWVQTIKLTATDAAINDRFGSSLSLAENRALIGASGDDDAGAYSGSAYVFDFDGLSWTQTQKMTANDAATGDQFGVSVSLGMNRALIGAYKDNDMGGNSGSAYIYDFDGFSWNQSQKITANDGASSDYFGYSVSLDASRLLIGASSDNNQESNSGSAYVYDFDGDSWKLTQKLIAADGQQADQLGSAVSLSGGLALVSAIFDDDNGTNSGSAYVFESDDLIFQDEFE